MIALLCFFLTLFASPFKSKSRLEAENVALRHQLIVLQRPAGGRHRICARPRRPLSPLLPNLVFSTHRPECVTRHIPLWRGRSADFLRVSRLIENDNRRRSSHRKDSLSVRLTELDCLRVAAAPGYGKPWIAFARQKFTRSGFDERSNHLG